MKANRTRYIGCSVILASATKCAPYRDRAVRLVRDSFRAHSSVKDQVQSFRKRRRIVYTKVLCDLLSSDIGKLVGTTPLDWKTCFTVGGTGSTVDNAAAEQLYDCILETVGIKQTHEFTHDTAEKFRIEAGRATRYNRMMLGIALVELEKEGRIFDLTDAKGDKLYAKLKSQVPGSHLQKEEIKTISHSIVHAASGGIDAVYFTCEDFFDDAGTKSKVDKAVREVLRLSPQDYLEVAHISASWF